MSLLIVYKSCVLYCWMIITKWSVTMPRCVLCPVLFWALRGKVATEEHRLRTAVPITCRLWGKQTPLGPRLSSGCFAGCGCQILSSLPARRPLSLSSQPFKHLESSSSTHPHFGANKALKIHFCLQTQTQTSILTANFHLVCIFVPIHPPAYLVPGPAV